MLHALISSFSQNFCVYFILMLPKEEEEEKTTVFFFALNVFDEIFFLMFVLRFFL